MIPTDPFADRQPVSTDHCPACGADTPAGAFCGSCGADLSGNRRHGRDRLRLGTYAAAPGERVLRPAFVSAMFPHLPRRSRWSFRIGLLVLVVALAVFVVLGWQAPMIATAAFGLPVLFVIYLREIDIRGDVALRHALLAVVIGVVLGVGWAYVAGTVLADGYDVALGSETNAGPALGTSLAISVCEALLMLVPTVAVRVLHRSPRESLDGFLIGALGATAFTAAATLTLLAPQLSTGPLAEGRARGHLIVEAGVQGVAMSLASVAVGGIFGAALWYTKQGNTFRGQRGPVTAAVSAAVLVVIVVFVAFGYLDVAPVSDYAYLAGYLLITALALIALRIALQAALLHEAHEETGPGGQLRCAQCDHVVPYLAFCPDCGAATRAASRRSRADRRVDESSDVSPPARHRTHTRVLLAMGAGIGVAAAVAVVVSMLITPAAPRYVCPPNCGQPPMGTPVETNPRFTAANGAFSVSYPGKGTAYKATFNPDGVVLDFVAGDGGTLALFGEPAQNRTPQEIAMSLINKQYPDATVAYEIPNASVGYQPGYGVIADDYPQSSNGKYARLRVLITVAVKHDLALIAAAVGPYHKFSPDYGSGHPSGANLQLAIDMGKYVNSFQWRGDRFGRRNG